jgi:M6 family metalloprotease-like protein
MFTLPVSYAGILDHLVVIHSSWGAELGGGGACNANEQADRIWSQGSAANNGDGIKLQSGNFEVGGYILGSSMASNVCNPDPASIGVIAHEFLHGFKLVDLYDQDSDEGPVSIGGVG